MALGAEVTVKKVVGHPRGYKWRANFIGEGQRKQKYFKTKSAADEWAEDRKGESLEHGTGSTLSAEERSAVIESRTGTPPEKVDTARLVRLILV